MRSDLGSSYYALIRGILFFTCVSGTAGADFYTKDFAKAPGGTTNESLTLPRPLGVKAETPAIPKSVLEKTNGERVLEFGVLVNISDADAILSVLDQSVRNVPAAKLGPIAIAGGKPSGALTARLSGFRVRGAKLVAPDNSLFAGTLVSPSWVVGTASGYHMLEGLSDPMLYINSRGEFVSHDSVKPEPPKPVNAEAF